MGTILLIILILLLLGALPPWHGLGPYPAGGIGLLIIVLVVLLLMGRI